MKFWDRLLTAINTVTDKEQAQLLLQGPLPLWMQEIFEAEAKRRGVDVSTIIFRALSQGAIWMRDKQQEQQ